MPSNPFPYRPLVIAALVVAVAGASGCSWFRKGSTLYRESPENRPLEVPPDLDRPNTDSAMKMPPGGGSVSRSSMSAPAATAAGNTGFTVEGERDAVFDRLGTALAGIEGVTVVTRAQLLGSFDIDYRGSKFLVRVAKAEGGSYVSAVDPRGLPATGEAPVQLMAALKAALGG
ncbi:hypothetical protein [Luteimonas vadosa]|uniref:Beta-barrel assembly machine subunit BamC n=1 Tax=Luteimonas vadosa TaxID=1165507 RepID=A0ABP9DYV3_9GAMM